MFELTMRPFGAHFHPPGRDQGGDHFAGFHAHLMRIRGAEASDGW
jgi:hypothetical protein